MLSVGPIQNLHCVKLYKHTITRLSVDSSVNNNTIPLNCLKPHSSFKGCFKQWTIEEQLRSGTRPKKFYLLMI